MPWSWWEAGPAARPAEPLEMIQERVAWGVYYFAVLSPAVLALVPGVMRACIRVKMLLPGAVLPGWLLVAAAPFNGLLALAAFVSLAQVAPNPLLLAGMLLWLAAPLTYLARAGVFTRPIATAAELRTARRVRGVARVLALGVGGLPARLCPDLGSVRVPAGRLRRRDVPLPPLAGRPLPPRFLRPGPVRHRPRRRPAAPGDAGGLAAPARVRGRPRGGGVRPADGAAGASRPGSPRMKRKYPTRRSGGGGAVMRSAIEGGRPPRRSRRRGDEFVGAMSRPDREDGTIEGPRPRGGRPTPPRRARARG